jgi:hypothetical protein
MRKEAIEKKLRHAGWTAAISNYIDTAKEAIRIYGSKDAAEKCFDRMQRIIWIWQDCVCTVMLPCRIGFSSASLP